MYCNETIHSVHNDEISSSENLFEKSRDCSLPHSFVEMAVNPVNKFEPLNIRRTSHIDNLSSSFLDISVAESSSFSHFSNQVVKYGLVKKFLHDNNIVIPGIKTFFSIPSTNTEKSLFSSVAVLKETADNQDTLLRFMLQLD